MITQSHKFLCRLQPLDIRGPSSNGLVARTYRRGWGASPPPQALDLPLVGSTRALLMQNRSHPHALGVGTIILKLTLGKIIKQVLSIKGNIVRGSLLCIYGFQLVFEQMCVV